MLLWECEIIGIRTPSKKNSRINFSRGGKNISLPSKDYEGWKKVLGVALMSNKMLPKSPLQGPMRAEFMLYWGDLRRHDISNKWESVADALTDLRVIEDDNSEVIKEILMRDTTKKGGPFGFALKLFSL